ncbi:hypothetical protein [Helicobacter pylori]|uniref:hypothetical protein n=1 Tax=Helicobacter pylori TaxID=210 RepID=UPI0035C6A7E8
MLEVFCKSISRQFISLIIINNVFLFSSILSSIIARNGGSFTMSVSSIIAPTNSQCLSHHSHIACHTLLHLGMFLIAEKLIFDTSIDKYSSLSSKGLSQLVISGNQWNKKAYFLGSCGMVLQGCSNLFFILSDCSLNFALIFSNVSLFLSELSINFDKLYSLKVKRMCNKSFSLRFLYATLAFFLSFLCSIGFIHLLKFISFNLNVSLYWFKKLPQEFLRSSQYFLWLRVSLASGNNSSRASLTDCITSFIKLSV